MTAPSGRRRVVRLAVRSALVFGFLALVVWLSQARSHDFGGASWLAITRDTAGADSLWLVERTRIRLGHGDEVPCIVRRPASGERAPVMLIAGGERTGARAALLVGPSFRGATMACDYPWRGPGRRSTLGFILALPRVRGDIVSTPKLHAYVASWLAGRAWVDTARFAAVGVSLGVPSIAAWAADDGRAKAVALVYGGARLDLLLDRAMERDISGAGTRRRVARFLAWLVAPLDPARTAPRIAPRPLLVALAEGDQRIPAASTEALIAAAGPTARVLRLPGAHMQAGDSTLFRTLTDSTVAWLGQVFGTP